MPKRSIAILVAAVSALVVPGAASAADAVSRAGPVAVPVDDAGTPAQAANGGIAILPSISNVFDSRHDYAVVGAGAPGTGSSYVERVPRTLGLTLRAPL